MTFKQDEHQTPVLFRMGRLAADRHHGPTAVFPCEPATYSGPDMSCYAHVGQHSGCSPGWYNTTRAATPAEYADLAKELEGAPYGYRLKVYRRIQPWMRDALRAEQQRLEKRA